MGAKLITKGQWMALAQSRDMRIVRRNEGGAPVYDACSNPAVVAAGDHPADVCFFDLDEPGRQRFRVHVSRLALSGHGSYVHKTGCRMDCRPYTEPKADPRQEITEAWQTTSDDGKCQPALHIKRDLLLDDNGMPIWDIEEESGCPYFMDNVLPQSQSGLIQLGPRR